MVAGSNAACSETERRQRESGEPNVTQEPRRLLRLHVLQVLLQPRPRPSTADEPLMFPQPISQPDQPRTGTREAAPRSGVVA